MEDSLKIFKVLSQINGCSASSIILDFNFYLFSFWINKEALMVYSAIPLSAVGGIILWMRGLPFSISAGVGFIALLVLRFSTESY
jgi:Cu/Ag efflux pump CusA